MVDSHGMEHAFVLRDGGKLGNNIFFSSWPYRSMLYLTAVALGRGVSTYSEEKELKENSPPPLANPCARHCFTVSFILIITFLKTRLFYSKVKLGTMSEVVGLLFLLGFWIDYEIPL